MLELFQPRLRGDGLLGVCVAAGGIALAQVRREAGVAPVLQHCEFLPAAPGADPCAQLARRREFERLPCATAIDAGEYSLLLVEAPEVPPEELRAAMRWRVKDLIDFHIDDAVIDVFDVPADKGGRARLMYVVVARANAVRRRADALLDAGLPLQAIDIPELAMRNLAALLPEDVGGVALIELGPAHGLVTITRQATLYLSRRFEPGADALLGDATRLTGELEGRLDSIIVEVQRSLDYYESHFGQPPVAGVVLGPLAREVQGLTDYLGSQLGVRVQSLDLNRLLDCANAIDLPTQARCLTAVGVALRSEAGMP